MTYSDVNINVIFDEGVLNVFSHFKQTGNKHEKGGILLGKRLENNKILVTKATTPTLFDKSYRYSFHRDKKSAQLFINYEFLNSLGKTIYIGEWHTHPEDYPTPSSTDIKMIKNQFKKNLINEDFLLMVIVGRKGFYIGHFNGKKLIQLKQNSQ
ncbi:MULTISPECIES: Mov34/MPN/PAD-1 family protein [Flagellimonas]|uniref:Mov34/MPN/PAD-1 family protein n=2 Tax=Flagellimonas TaxID=444459 RepID=A0ABT5XRL2_9FLAO|nr:MULTISPECIES: Mov34/MPN/PAD-1 family protein [Allomuricauda]MBO0356202.1 Mov34/MPN/PAD-1 family protein [Allomuricauda aurea]MDF0708548.1 Mov34/MPN/PAD-1 family protein [[Muricauda] okinawensis]